MQMAKAYLKTFMHHKKHSDVQSQLNQPQLSPLRIASKCRLHGFFFSRRKTIKAPYKCIQESITT